MRFSRGEVVFYRLKIRSKTANVAEVNVEKVKGGVKTFGVHYQERSLTWGHFWSPPQKGTLRYIGNQLLLQTTTEVLEPRMSDKLVH
ncbi:hypothetical protein E2C01_000243 [Portunus trituberculatus]|uniref:Uncharacterized protein n=1 Tax=Portunus trituberculatus TaxID=210409 RepID=A0A5B7CEM7_PORTR|nr:hypothetical protein [Portunus trituberculatus]